MSWLFSQALVEAFSEATSLDGEPCAPLSVMPTPHKFWRNDKMMEFSKLSQFGLTCAVLTEDRGEALLTSFRAAFPARTSPVLAKVKESTVPALASGRNFAGSLARFDPDTSSWKTPQCSLIEGLDEFSGTWPRWGSMRSGVCWALPTPSGILAIRARIMSAKESGSSQRMPTPMASDCEDRGGHRGVPDTLTSFTKTWPTPRNNTGPSLDARHLSLDGDVRHWPTITVNGNYNRKGLSSQSGDGLATAVNHFPTPCARDFRSPNLKPYSERGGGGKGEQLVNHIAHFPTPIATNTKANHMRGNDKGKKREARSYTTPCADDTGHRKDKFAQGGDPLSHQVGGQLNPPWVEWLQGWPIGWTESKPLAMAKFQQWSDSLSRPSKIA